MLNIAIIGCGNIADTHALQIKRIKSAFISAVCDKEILMAKQFSERHGISHCFDNVEDMLKYAKPDVVHITSPPSSHFSVGTQCLEFGSHVYIEKPFTLYASEAKDLIRFADKRGLKLTVGHNAQFTPKMVSMRNLVNKGYLGGDPIHMESIYCYSFNSAQSASGLIGDQDHWIRKLPGKLLHNIISHGIAKITEYIKSDAPTVIAHGSTSPLLIEMGEKTIIDELRVIIDDNINTTAYFSFSSQINPPQHLFRVYGPKNSLIFNHSQQTLIMHPGKQYRSYLNQFIPPFKGGVQLINNAFENVIKFLCNDFHSDAGMKNLIQSFYESITQNKPVPIPYREIVLATKIMESIFYQLDAKI